MNSAVVLEYISGCSINYLMTKLCTKRNIPKNRAIKQALVTESFIQELLDKGVVIKLHLPCGKIEELTFKKNYD